MRLDSLLAMLSLCLPINCYSAQTQTVAQTITQVAWSPLSLTADQTLILKQFIYDLMKVDSTEITISESTTQNNIETSIQKKYLQCPTGTYLSIIKGINPNWINYLSYGMGGLSAGMAAHFSSYKPALCFFGLSSLCMFFYPSYNSYFRLIAKRLHCPTPPGADPHYEYFLLSSTSKIHSIKSI